MQMRSLAWTPSAHMRIPGKERPGPCHDVSRCCCTRMVMPGAEHLISTIYVYRRSCFTKIIYLCVGSVHVPQDMYVFKTGFWYTSPSNRKNIILCSTSDHWYPKVGTGKILLNMLWVHGRTHLTEFVPPGAHDMYYRANCVMDTHQGPELQCHLEVGKDLS